jgi:hypothetical protein
VTTPETGYEVPRDAIPSGLPALDPARDPLVAPPQAGIGQWARRLAATLRRSGGPLLVLLLVAAIVSTVVQFLIQTILMAAWRPDEVVWFLLISDLASVGGLFVTSIAWGAGIWLVTQHAAGQPLRFGAALAIGARHSPVMFGWALVLFAPMTVAGTLSYEVSGSLLVALLPVGLYWGLAGSLVSFAVVYERGATAMLRSVLLVHRAFGAALARVLPALLLYLAGLLVTGLTTTWLWAGADLVGRDALDLAGMSLVAAVLGAAVDVPVSTAVLVGLLLTYAQLRGREEPLSTAALAAAASRRET